MSRRPTDEQLDKEYQAWYDRQSFDVITDADTARLALLLTSELQELSKMSVQEYTLHQKWRELQENKKKYQTVGAVDAFFGTITDQVSTLKNMIWIPEDPEEYLDLEPQVVVCKNNQALTKLWGDLRMFVHTMHFNPNIGRSARFLVIDKKTDKVLGLLGLSGDFLDLTPRDNWIGWTREQRNKGMLKHSAIGSTIVPTQPLGYSYLGGKLCALLMVSSVVEDTYNEYYPEKLAGMTTTSLYGSFSQYNNLKYWKKMGRSSGSIKFEPSKKTIYKMRNWLRNTHPRKYWEWYEAKDLKGLPLKRDHRQRSWAFIYRKLDIPNEIVETNHQRGIYYCRLYQRTKMFLREERDNLGKKLFDNSPEALSKLWKEKYASKRVDKLLKDGRYSNETLFYGEDLDLDWPEFKAKFLGDVGR
jgi:hypothetical protein